MRSIRTLLLISASLTTTIAFNESSYADVMRYNAVDLGTLPTADRSIPTGINNLGQVIGLANSDYSGVGSFLYKNGQMSRIDVGLPRAINDSGQITSANGINAGGLVVGTNGFGQAYSQQNGIASAFPALEPGGRSDANGVNDSGQAVGDATRGGVLQPVLFSNGQVTSLGLTSQYVLGSAQSINNAGEIIGFYQGADGSSHAFANIAGRTIILDLLGGTSNDAKSINASGEIVGWSTTADGSRHAFLYDGNKMFDLNTLVKMGGGLTLTEAVGINDKGQIAVRAVDALGHDHALLLTPNAVPEPTTIALAGMVAALLLGRRLWRRP